MIIRENRNGSALNIELEGRLDTTTSPELEEELKKVLPELTELIFDLSKLEYISSAGLRVLLSAQKTMNRQGKMCVSGANDTVAEIFDITGFSSILHIV